MKGRIQKHQNQYLMKIVMWLNWVFTVASPDCSEKLDVYLFMTDLIKRLPDTSRTPLGPINVNTAYTTPCSRHTKIILYRYEEWFKVLIHETMHCLGLDFSSMNGEKYDQQVLSLFKGCDPNTNLSLTETYSELWAEIINILFCVMNDRENRRVNIRTHKRNFTHQHVRVRKQNNTRKSPDSIKNIVQKIQHRLWMEQQFSVFQCAKILSHYGITYEQLCKGGESILYRENTPVLAYYFIKSMILLDINTFIEWCGKHNRVHPIRITQTHSTLNSFVYLIHKRYQNPEWVRIIQSVQKKIETNDLPSSSDIIWIKQTLRMTVNDCVW
jgi:hypothetical protein